MSSGHTSIHKARSSGRPAKYLDAFQIRAAPSKLREQPMGHITYVNFRDRLLLNLFPSRSRVHFWFPAQFGGAQAAAQHILQLKDKPVPAAEAAGPGLTTDSVDDIGFVRPG